MGMNGIDECEEKWYTRNNRRLWCFTEAAVNAVQVRVRCAERAPLPGLTARMVPPVVLYPPTVCKACSEECASRTNLHNHDCERRLELAAPPVWLRGSGWPSGASPPAEPLLGVC